MTQQFIATQSQPTQNPFDKTFDSLSHSLGTTNGLLLLGAIGALVALSLLDKKGSKGKLAKEKFGGASELSYAKRVALKQMQQRQRQPASIWLGRPRPTPFGKKPIYLPDIQRGFAVLGAPGTGKTVSILDQAVHSILEQGFPLILWDYKYPAQTSRHAAYAKHLGYDVKIFAPGFPESESCNPLDFIADQNDATMARQFAEVMNANFAKASENRDDQFFKGSGDLVTQGLLLLAKTTPYPDLIVAQELCSRKDMPRQLIRKRNELDPWILKTFGQLIAGANSEKTIGSILATASLNLTKLMLPDVAAAFCRQSTIPTRLEGKQMLIIGIDRERKDVLAPLVATIIHLLINRNISHREDPLFFVADELPTLYLPRLNDWLSQNREDGLCIIIGAQHIVQLKEKYGENLSREILGDCATKAILNPQDPETAKFFSDYLGEKEVSFKQKSRGRSGGKASTNLSEQTQIRPLMSASEFTHMTEGECVLINPHFRKGRRGYIPLRMKIALDDHYQTILDWSKGNWAALRDWLVARSPVKPFTRKEIEARRSAADAIFPVESERDDDKRFVELM